MGVLLELIGVLLLGALGFLLTIAYIIGFIVVAICALAAGLCAIGVLFCLFGWLFLHSHDAFLAMLDFLAWGCVPFAMMVSVMYYRDKLTASFMAAGQHSAPRRAVAGPPRNVAASSATPDEPFIAAPRFDLRVTPPRPGGLD